MAKVTYKAPFRHRSGAMEVFTMTGDVAWMKIGETKVRCVMQKDRDEVSLVHYATGQRIIQNNTIRALQVQYAVTRGTYHKLTDREAAERLLAEIVKAKGPDQVLKVLNAAPVLNA